MCSWLCARSLANWVASGAFLASFSTNAASFRIRLEREGGTAAGAVDGADVVVAARELALELHGGRVGLGQLLADGPCLLVRRERRGGLAPVILDPGDSLEAFRHRPRGTMRQPIRAGPAVSRPRAPAGKTKWLGSGRRSLQACRRWRSGSGPDRAWRRAPDSGSSASLRRRSRPRLQRAERFGVQADPGCQLADFMISLPERLATADRTGP